MRWISRNVLNVWRRKLPRNLNGRLHTIENAVRRRDGERPWRAFVSWGTTEAEIAAETRAFLGDADYERFLRGELTLINVHYEDVLPADDGRHV